MATLYVYAVDAVFFTACACPCMLHQVMLWSWILRQEHLSTNFRKDALRTASLCGILGIRYVASVALLIEREQAPKRMLDVDNA